MAIPDYQAIMLPLLNLLADGQEHPFIVIADKLAEELKLSDTEKKELNPAGNQRLYTERMSVAALFLSRAGLLRVDKESDMAITSKGMTVVKEKLNCIDVKYLMQYPEFAEFYSPGNTTVVKVKTGDSVKIKSPTVQEFESPEEGIGRNYHEHRTRMVSELNNRIKACPSYIFEKLIIDFLRSTGHVAKPEEITRAMGDIHNGIVEGLFRTDRFGFEHVYVKAVRQSMPMIQENITEMLESLKLSGAEKGLCISVSGFGQGASEIVSKEGAKIILMDGNCLAESLFDLGLGVTTRYVYHICSLDTAYFA